MSVCVCVCEYKNMKNIQRRYIFIYILLNTIV